MDVFIRLAMVLVEEKLKMILSFYLIPYKRELALLNLPVYTILPVLLQIMQNIKEY